MNVRLKRAKELAGYAVQLTKEEGLPTMVRRGAGFVKRRCLANVRATCPPKRCWKPSVQRWQAKRRQTAACPPSRC